MLYKSKIGPLTFYQYSFCEEKLKNSNKLFHSYKNFYERQDLKKHIEVIQHNIRFDLEDLTREKLLDKVSETLKKELKRAVKNEIKIYEVDKKEFIEKYNCFAKNKKLNEISEKLLDDLSAGNKMLIKKAVYKDLNVAYYLTICNSRKAIGVFGFPNRFEEKEFDSLTEKEIANLTSQGYKYLCFENIFDLKERKMKYFDTGEIYLDSEDLDKAKFTEAKLKFGGDIVEVYEYQSKLYHLAYNIKKYLENTSKGKIQRLWTIIRK